MNPHTDPIAAASSLRGVIDAQAGQPLSTDDILLLLLPLFAQVSALHERGRVAALDEGALQISDDGALSLRNPDGEPPRMAIAAIHEIQPRTSSALNIVGALQSEHRADGSQQISDLAVLTTVDAPITHPVYLPGLRSWEQALGHHDEITNVFLLGLLLSSLACGLDLAEEEDLRSFAAQRHNLFALHPGLHPIVAGVIVEMTALNRHERATDVAALATRLRTWREQPQGLDVERVMAGAQGSRSRRSAVLSHLRDRLFDLSRRNRLLYYRPSAAAVNLTVASVPLMLQIERIRAEQICSWGGPFAADVVAGKAVALQQWLRFEDQPYLPAALDRLITDTRRDRAEYGFSNLRLVVAFLRWHNLKESPDERITTPLLWLPVELVRRKGVRDQYVIQTEGGLAEFNPVLRHQLSQLYDIQLPETLDLGEQTLAQVHADILAQIRRSEPAVELRLIERPAIRLVRQKALQRMQQYQRRRPTRTPREAGSAWLPAYSYSREDYRPLGRALYEHWVAPSPLPQRFEAGAAPSARQPHMSEVAEAAGERTGYVLEEGEGHRYAWDLDLTQVTLANFNYRKMSLVRDYAQLLAQPDANPPLDRIFSIEPRELEAAAPPPLPITAQWNVVASDATQNAAVGLARHGRSFIIQGPPGTGKSQTITNLIADYAGRGQRVLFVCEKRAALDVVFHRLKQSGLAALCSLIHDSQSDKKAFITDLRGCYEEWIAQEHAQSTLLARRDALCAEISQHQARIDSFEAAMAQTNALAGNSLRALLRRVLTLPAAPEPGPVWRERLPTLANWDAQQALVQRVHRSLRERFGIASLAAHPFARLAPGLVASEQAFADAEACCQRGEASFDALDALLEDPHSLIRPQTLLDQARLLAADCQWLDQSGLARQPALLQPDSPAQTELAQLRSELTRLARELTSADEAAGRWHSPLSAEDTESALGIVRRCEHSLLRWLQPAWWRVRGEIRRRYDFTAHALHPGYGRVLEWLAARHAAAAALARLETDAAQRHGVADIHAFIASAADFSQRVQAGGSARTLLAHITSASEPQREIRATATALQALQQLADLGSTAVQIPPGMPLADLAELLRDLREALDELPDLLPLLRAVDAAEPACAGVLRGLDLAPDALDALMLDETLRRIEREQPEAQRFGGAGLALAARAIATGQRALHQLNAELIRATWHRRFADNVRISTLSATQLDAAGKALKKSYATGRRELEHEFGKSMRYRSIRDLSDDETGLVINDLKPIWLMSPLSVSDTLPLTAGLFDVVIFDEASQIPTEEAVPALCRARQVIVVGDEMQLPPTSFFSAGASEGEDEIVIEEDGERIAINLDSDSLLNQAARNLPATLLAWHYRSRHESLISFSNAAFYDGRLVTIPDRMLEHASTDAPALRSDADEAARLGIETLLARPISFHLLADGLYSERRNQAEAHYIARLVRELLSRDSGLSVGVVAFSEAQQDAIESALETLAGEDADFATRLEREYLREDEDQFNGLFIKNLENVQGDERDLIILSICYAPGPDGRMLMNFGPINQRGGEKRLNVIFSRARQRMAVVSSIQAEAITNTHNDGAAALRAFLQFAQRSARGEFEQAQSVLATLNPGASKAFARVETPDSVRDAIAQALRARGHTVHTHVGRSRLRCDLGIVAADAQGYALGILLDSPAEPVSDSTERYVFRPGILRSFGWRVLDIPARDWISTPDAVLARIDTMLARGEDSALDVELGLEPIAPPAALPSPPAPAAAPPSASQQASCELHFEQGSSCKFWRASLDDCELSISWGRVGSSGQSMLKQFDTPERARREMEKLIDEKRRKGYVDKPAQDTDPASGAA